MATWSEETHLIEEGAKRHTLQPFFDKLRYGSNKVTNPQRIEYIKKMKGLGYKLKDTVWRKKVGGKDVFVTDGMLPPEPKTDILTSAGRDKKIASLLKELLTGK